jgi:hypothetical protein
VAFLNGDNPYDRAYAEAYPVYGVQAPYSPFSQVVHAPFGLLPYEAAEWVYFAFSAGLMLALAWLALRVCGVAASADRVLGLAALIAVSRSGHIDLVLGQMSLQLVLAALLALHYARRRPWLAGLGLGIVSLKPTFAVPLAWLMFCRRDYRAVVIGTAIGTAGALVGALVICGGIRELPDFVRMFAASYQKVEGSAAVAPATAWSRVDVMTLYSQLPRAGDSRVSGAILAALCLILAGIWLAWQTRRTAAPREDIGADGPSGVLICVVTLVCCYHMVYDALLLTAAVVAVCLGRNDAWRSLKPAARWGLAAALALPMINYASARTTLAFFGITGPLRNLLACSSALALLFAWGLLMLAQARRRPQLVASQTLPAPQR